MNILSIDRLTKRFGDHTVLNDLSLTVEEHSIFGFIGKNGAGKTTSMKLILGFLQADNGTVEVCGERVVYGGAKTNRHIGYLPDVPAFYPYMTPREYLSLCGEMEGISKQQSKEKAAELLDLVGLADANRRIKGFSRGMKQRLGIAQALLGEPQLLLCDEPTSALDPAGRREILDILLRVREKTTILFSTHILSDVENICDHIGILNHGALQLQGKLSDIKSSYRQDSILLEPAHNAQLSPLLKKIAELPTVLRVVPQETSIMAHTKDVESAQRQMLELVLKESIPLKTFAVQEPQLEHIFLEVTQ